MAFRRRMRRRRFGRRRFGRRKFGKRRGMRPLRVGVRM